MAETCPNCGKLLAQEEICECTIDTPVEEEKSASSFHSPVESQQDTRTCTSSYNKPSEDVTNNTCCTAKEKNCTKLSYNLGGVIKSFFKKPYTVTILSIKQNYCIGLLFLCLQSIVISLYSVALINHLVDGTSRWLPSIDRVLGLGGLLRFWSRSVEIPYVEIFLKVFCIVIIQFFILAGLFFISGKLFGRINGSFSCIVSTMGIASIISTATFVVALLLLPIYLPLTTYILLFGFLATILLNHAGAREAFGMEENKGTYLTPLIYIIYFLILNLFLVESLKSSIKLFW